MDTTLTFIANDQVNRLGLVAEHGNTILVENNFGRILFDTGQGLAIEKNLKVLNIDINTIDAIAISHGHNDHTGGILQVLRLMDQDKTTKIFGHEDIFNHRQKIISGSKSQIGNPYTLEDLTRANGEFIQNKERIEIIKNIYLSGTIPRIFEKTNSVDHYQRKNNKNIKDPFNDDQALVVKSKNGLSIIFGCAHAGVINTIEYVCKEFQTDTLYGLFGGTHLLHENENKLKEILAVIEDKETQVIGFNHCTGNGAIEFFKKHFSGKVLDASTGSTIKI